MIAVAFQRTVDKDALVRRAVALLDAKAVEQRRCAKLSAATCAVHCQLFGVTTGPHTTVPRHSALGQVRARACHDTARSAALVKLAGNTNATVEENSSDAYEHEKWASVRYRVAKEDTERERASERRKNAAHLHSSCFHRRKQTVLCAPKQSICRQHEQSYHQHVDEHELN